MVDTLLDALEHSLLPLTQARIFSWHCTLFPQKMSGPFPIHAGRYRTEPIEVIAGSYKNQEVLYEAPPFERVPQEMEGFLAWVNTASTLPNTVRSAIAHLWFLSIHPFEDGNGRMARTIGDYVLNQHNPTNLVLFSLATQLKRHQRAYYEHLHEAQTGSLDCTGWILWYLTQIRETLEIVIETIEKTLKVGRLFQRLSLNDRQSAMLGRLTTDFYGALTTQKWAKLSGCSHDTAMRDIKDLIENGALKQSEKGGRSTSYELVLE
ncbi:MAG: Fic family protein [Sphaerochaeta sp.]|nr:Fic family protein [Sphaerochaeta sp.]